MFRNFEALAAALLLLTAPASGQAAAPPAPASAAPALDAHLAFVGEVGRVSTEQIGAMRRIVDAKPLLESLATPAGVRANGSKVRAIVAQTRQALLAIGQRLEAINAPDTPFAPIKPASILGDLREQNVKMIGLLSDYEALILAAEKGDVATHARFVPKVSNGAFLLLDAMQLTLRNRQSAISPDRSTYQGLGVGIYLYRAMAAAGRAWYNAHLARQPELAAADLRMALSGMAEKLRALGSDGRANISSEIARLERATQGASAREARTIAQLGAATAERRKLFDVGDEIAAWAARAEKVTAAQLAAQAKPVLMEPLIALEMRYQSIAAAEATAGIGSAP